MALASRPALMQGPQPVKMEGHQSTTSGEASGAHGAATSVGPSAANVEQVTALLDDLLKYYYYYYYYYYY